MQIGASLLKFSAKLSVPQSLWPRDQCTVDEKMIRFVIFAPFTLLRRNRCKRCAKRDYNVFATGADADDGHKDDEDDASKTKETMNAWLTN